MAIVQRHILDPSSWRGRIKGCSPKQFFNPIFGQISWIIFENSGVSWPPIPPIGHITAVVLYCTSLITQLNTLLHYQSSQEYTSSMMIVIFCDFLCILFLVHLTSFLCSEYGSDGMSLCGLTLTPSFFKKLLVKSSHPCQKKGTINSIPQWIQTSGKPRHGTLSK